MHNSATQQPRNHESDQLPAMEMLFYLFGILFGGFLICKAFYASPRIGPETFASDAQHRSPEEQVVIVKYRRIFALTGGVWWIGTSALGLLSLVPFSLWFAGILLFQGGAMLFALYLNKRYRLNVS
jgi:hypothetical protein